MGKNKSAMSNSITVKSPAKAQSGPKSKAPSGATPAYKSGGMTKGKKKC